MLPVAAGIRAGPGTCVAGLTMRFWGDDTISRAGRITGARHERLLPGQCGARLNSGNSAAQHRPGDQDLLAGRLPGALSGLVVLRVRFQD
jgi:hypothetical protein